MYKYIYYCPVSYANRRCCREAAPSLRLTLKITNIGGVALHSLPPHGEKRYSFVI